MPMDYFGRILLIKGTSAGILSDAISEPCFDRAWHPTLRINLCLPEHLGTGLHMEYPPSSNWKKSRRSLLWPVFLVSFAALYLELLLIRWIGTEVRVFAYFQNLALIACFLGFGLGCYQSARKKGGLFGLIALGILIIAIEIPFHGGKRCWSFFLRALTFDGCAIVVVLERADTCRWPSSCF